MGNYGETWLFLLTLRFTQGPLVIEGYVRRQFLRIGEDGNG